MSSERPLALLKDAISMWPEVQVKYNLFEVAPPSPFLTKALKKMLSPTEQQPQSVVQGLAILDTLTESVVQIRRFFQEKAMPFQTVLVTGLGMESPKVWLFCFS